MIATPLHPTVSIAITAVIVIMISAISICISHSNSRSYVKTVSPTLGNANKFTSWVRKRGDVDKVVKANVDVNVYFPLSVIPTKHDKKIIEERQINGKVDDIICCSKSCKYGFPQAYVQYPVAGGISSGMLRLSCPHLVQSIDTYEKLGAIERMNSVLYQQRITATDIAGTTAATSVATNGDRSSVSSIDSSSIDVESFSDNYIKINEQWKEIRSKAVSSDDMNTIVKYLGEENKDNFLNSGIIGVHSTKDVKCFHAHVADQLLRGSNLIGKHALDELEGAGIDITGNDRCYQQCDLSVQPNNDTWYYTPQKNKQKLRTARIRRAQNKVNIYKNSYTASTDDNSSSSSSSGSEGVN